MVANLQNLKDFLQTPKTQFEIPIYQRNYDWREVHCDQLFHDIKNVALDETRLSHFVGSIVYISDSVYHTADLKRLVIIDGQQRLTTITLLLLAIAKRYQSLGKEKEKDEILEDYIINKRIEKEKLKLRPVTKDDLALHHLLENLTDEGFSEYSRIIHNFKYLSEKLEKENLDVIQKGFSKLFFVEISLERGKDNPQRIFESLNSTGLDLSQGDLIRNYILMDLQPDEQKKIYMEYWLKIENNTRDLQLNQPKISDFIRDYLTFKFREIPTKQNVYTEFKKRFDVSDANLNSRTELLAEILKYSSYYFKLLNPNKEQSDAIKGRLKQIQKIEVIVSYPFLLEVYNDYATNLIDHNGFVESLDVLISFVWRRFICQLPTNALNKLFMYLYRDIDKSNYLESLKIALMRKTGKVRMPSDTELRQGLLTRDCYNTESKNKLYFLERLENFNNNEHVQIQENDLITIEHVFPQKPVSDWETDLGEEYVKFKEQYLHTITNLTLSGNNGDLSNKRFIFKRDLPEKGYKDSKLFLNRYLGTAPKWGEKEYLERFEIIYNKFIQIWKYPDVQIIRDTEGEMDLMDIESATNKSIDYVIFNGVRRDTITYMDLLKIVAKSMFDVDPERFTNGSLNVKLKTTTDKSTLSDPVELGGGYFIEGQGSANTRIKKIKTILLEFDFDEELTIRFK